MRQAASSEFEPSNPQAVPSASPWSKSSLVAGLILGVLSSLIATSLESVLSFVSAGRLTYEAKSQTLVIRTFPVINGQFPGTEMEHYMEEYPRGAISGSEGEGFLVRARLTLGPRDGSVNIQDGSQWIIQELSIFYVTHLGEHFPVDRIEEITMLSGSKVAEPERGVNCSVIYEWAVASQPTERDFEDLHVPAEPRERQLPFLVLKITTKKKSLFGSSCNLST